MFLMNTLEIYTTMYHLLKTLKANKIISKHFSSAKVSRHTYTQNIYIAFASDKKSVYGHF